MTKNQLTDLFTNLLQEIRNPLNKRLFSNYPEFNYSEYQSTIEDYAKNIDLLFYCGDEDFKQKIIDYATVILHNYKNNTIDDYLKTIFDAVNFLKSNNPEVYPEHYRENAIQKKVFDERYDKLISLLTDQHADFSALTLNTIDTGTPFKLFKNNNNSIVVKAGEEKAFMSVSKDKLKRVLYNHENYTYKSYEEVILQKLLDNSIFDLIEEQSISAKERIKNSIEKSTESIENKKLEKLEEERLKTAGKLSDLEDTLTSYKDKFENLNSILEESKNVKQDFQNAKESALKEIALQKSHEFWEKQSFWYKVRYWSYLFVTIVLSGILLSWIYNYLEDNPFGKNSIIPATKQFVHNVESNRTKLLIHKDSNKSSINEQSLVKVKNKKPTPSVAKDSNKSSINEQSLVKVENKKPIPSVAKDSNQSLSTDETDLDKMMKFLHYGFLVLFSSMAIWFIRILMKITLSNYHLSIDADERIIMIRTYLSLIQEGAVSDPNEKKIILDNIFRPTNFGIIKDESSVTVTDIISSLKK